MPPAEQEEVLTVVSPPCVRCTRWWNCRYLSSPHHPHPPSRCSTARRVAGAGSRLALPASTTAESGPSNTRRTLAAQLSRCTVTPDTGTAPLISPAGATAAASSSQGEETAATSHMNVVYEHMFV